MKKLFFIFLLIFFLIIVNWKEYNCEINNDINFKIEKYVLERYQFTECGIKLEYISKNNIEDEKIRIKRILKDKYELKNIIDESSININIENIEYTINIFNCDNEVRVEVIILSNDHKKLYKTLKELAQEIRGSNFKSERYFWFIKVNVDNENESKLKDISSSFGIDLVEYDQINNGITARGKLANDEIINIGQINYDTGSYLIIGTPIIFVTY